MASSGSSIPISSDQDSSSNETAPPAGMVTLVFSDLVSSTELWEKAPAAMREALSLHNRLMRRLMRRHGGYEVSNEGDAFFVVFTDPVAALRYCLAVQLDLPREDWPHEILELLPDRPDRAGGLRVRMGVHIGEPQREPNPVTGRLHFIGPVTNRAARIMSRAEGGQILVSERAWRAVGASIEKEAVVRDIGEVRMKGLEHPERLMLVLPRGAEKRHDAADRLVDGSGGTGGARGATTGATRAAGQPGVRRHRTLDRVRDVMVLFLCMCVLGLELYVLAAYAGAEVSAMLPDWLTGGRESDSSSEEARPKPRLVGREREPEFAVPVMNPIEDAFMEEQARERARRAGVK